MGHVARMGHEKCTQYFSHKPEGMRSLGRPRSR